ncbi:hypothetical protein [Novipirellula artificiosorum]|uniref:Uncharacterized protein n=1 Tax=Novipirellula artificiosorum TaxID=2528016 RepID=A0A5C6DW73_9BACT|nr:hypothetical protein [Novipirellula artificiosorum]TWU40842.1 hypothetical protein Poly41_16770 [Novipirellula artificiosorum]
MNDKRSEAEKQKNAEIEREILAQRGYSLADAIGRMGGERMLKGTSPVTRKRQAELEIERYLEQHLVDTEGALEIVLLRRFRTSETVLKQGYEKPVEAFAALISGLVENTERLHGLVDDVDAEWGRMYLERPHFERPGQPADAEDPYTFDSVRVKLRRLLETMGS